MLKGQRAKRLLAMLTVFFFIAGSVFAGAATKSKVAYAATKNEFPAVDLTKLTSDVSDKNTKDAVMRLAAFGIVNGMEDGKYHPDEKVTREQFAKLLVTALGMESAAKAGAGHVSFKDVAPSRWSAGYISVAAGQGLIKGYPDGTFKPDKEVSYAEAITMLVRALGYKDEFLPGKWPGNYLAKAAEKEVTKYVKFTDVNGFANRGECAILVNNTLDAKVVKVDTYESGNVKYYESEKTLLEDKLNITKLEDKRIIANNRLDDSLNEDNNEVTVVDAKDNSNAKDYDVVAGYNVEPVLGEEVTIYLNDDDEIVYAEREYEDKAMFDYASSANDDKTLSLVKFDDDYKFDENAVVYVSDADGAIKYEGEDEINANLSKLVGKPGKFVVKNSKIVFADLINPDQTDDGWMVVTENNSGVIKGITPNTDKLDNVSEIDLREDETFDKVVVLDTNGNALTVNDIQNGNVIYVGKQDIDGDTYAVVRVVKDNVITGEFTGYKLSSSERKIGIDGKYIKASVHEAKYSTNGGDDIKYFNTTNSDVDNDMEDLDEVSITAYLDGAGRIAYFVGSTTESSGYKYGIVTKIYEESEKIKIYTVTNDGEGDEIVYPVEETKNLTKDKNGNPIAAGSLVKFKLNKNGEIAEDEIYVVDLSNYYVMDDDFGKDSIKTTSGKSISVDSKTVIFDLRNVKAYTDINTDTDSINEVVYSKDATRYSLDITAADTDDDFDVVKWSDLAEDDKVDVPFYVILDDNGVDAKAIFFVSSTSTGVTDSSSDEIPVYVVDMWKKSGDVYVTIHPYGEGTKDVKVDSTWKNSIEDERPYVVKIQADGELEIVTSSNDYEEYYGVITAKSGDTVTADVYKVGTSTLETKKFKLPANAIVYEEDEKKSASSIHTGDAVYFIVEDGVNIRVIERLIDDEAKAVLTDKKSPY
ncbi:Surface layer protein [Fervidicola ferrireducens]|uniref:Surface layer protein n=1 Tax=Fervidicola ferrireducens TaxID=520764 RepID=A0A140L8T1_9FIRM|nr:S-layer homology domain-containing protein [Fervidicola ferrireducens]KXG76956.1 Surface layer protein [Fervidicola ferrireducens]